MRPGGSYRGHAEPCTLPADPRKFKEREMPSNKLPNNKPDKSAKDATKEAIAKNQPVLRAIKGGKGAAKTPAARHDAAKHPTTPDDAPIIALKLEAAKLSPAMAAYFKKCQDKLGFV